MAAVEPARAEVSSRARAPWALLDLLVTGYLGLLCVAALQGDGPQRRVCLVSTFALFAFHALTTTLVRTHGGGGVGIALLYRIGTYGTLQTSYFVLRPLLPTARSVAYDAQLYALDVRLFGVEPTLWVDRFITPAFVEWFAFFYFSYFVLVALHFLPMVFFSRRPRLFAEFAMSSFLLFCSAHLLYFVVPGWGPYRFLAGHYVHALPHGRWYDLVLETVNAGGALKDIFPSLHTAGPTLMALFSFRHRDKLPFKYTWPLVAFFALNIMAATIVLRWHYLIDVIAGVTLALVMVRLGAALARWDEDRRAARGLPPTWPVLWGVVPEPVERRPPSMWSALRWWPAPDAPPRDDRRE